MNLDFLGEHSEIAKYWNERVVFFNKGFDFFADLPNSGDITSGLAGAIVGGKWREPFQTSINVSKLDRDGFHKQELGVAFPKAQSLYGDGYSLCFGDLSDGFLSLEGFKRTASVIFGDASLISVTAYLSPPGSVGVLHFDRQHNFFFQREGRKRWLVGRSASVKNPVENFVYNNVPAGLLLDFENMGYKIRLPKDCGRQAFTLEPGDVLYIPPGFFHSPETLDSHSFHYTLTLEPDCFWTSFLSRIQKKMLGHHNEFYSDYRFLDAADREALILKCLHIINGVD